jgi:Rha family phage regulatory protein
MNDLIQSFRNVPVVSSRRVAQDFGKHHQHILEKIRFLTVEISTVKLPKDFKPVFYEHIYTNSRGQKQPEIFMNRDGFTELVSNLNGKKAREWKRKYNAAFNRMEKVFTEKQTEAWLETRKAGKLTRRSETDVIKQLIEYAKSQGSTHADMLYVTYSKLANKIAGVSKRDLANIKQLNILDEIESMIFHVIELGMASGKHYKEIYQDCKRRLEWWQDCTFRLT